MEVIKIGNWEMVVPRSVVDDPAQLDVVIKMLKRINKVSEGKRDE